MLVHSFGSALYSSCVSSFFLLIGSGPSLEVCVVAVLTIAAFHRRESFLSSWVEIGKATSTVGSGHKRKVRERREHRRDPRDFLKCVKAGIILWKACSTTRKKVFFTPKKGLSSSRPPRPSSPGLHLRGRHCWPHLFPSKIPCNTSTRPMLLQRCRRLSRCHHHPLY